MIPPSARIPCSAPAAGDAAVLRVRGTRRGIALTTDCNARYCGLDPYLGGMHAIAEAARNLACVGAEPVAVTDCLNFGNPERPEIYFQLREAVRGLADACHALAIPVVSGNVSLYNDGIAGAILPTPMVGMAGILDDIDQRAGMAFPADATLVLLGPTDATTGASHLPRDGARHRSRRAAAARSPRPKPPSRRASAKRSAAAMCKPRTTSPMAAWPSRWRRGVSPVRSAAR